MKILTLIIFLIITKVHSFENLKINFGKFYLNKYEITILEFSKYADQNKLLTKAEKNGGGYEWSNGWKQKPGWNYRTPYGKYPDSKLEPAVHVNKFEAEAYCKFNGGRLPTFKEWSYAAYNQIFVSNEFQKGKIYKYPSGNKAQKMNSQGLLNYNKHFDVTKLPEGINGLVAMGGNVWEWIDEDQNNNSLTAGASWWYSGSKTTQQNMQYKPSNFFAVYVGFRCAYD